jgi:hypothetical protein
MMKSMLNFGSETGIIFSGHGPYRIKRDLQLKGISGDIIEEKVNVFFDEEKIVNKIKSCIIKKNPIIKNCLINNSCHYVIIYTKRFHR